MNAVQATRGCPNNCSFCSIHNIEGSVFRPRPIKDVVEEIGSISEKNIFFTDSSLTTNPKYTKTLFTHLKCFNKKYDCAGNVNILAKDDEFLKLASDAGVKQWHVGFESISQNIINNIGKKSNKITEYTSAVKKIKDNGMMIIGLFMFGFDNDKPDVFDSTLKAISEWDIDHVRFSILTPYPGTRIYDKFAAEGRILSKDWSLYDSDHVVIKPKNMSSRELYEGTKYSIKNFYSFSSLIKNTVNTKNLDFQDYLTKNWRSFFTTLFYRY